MYRGHRNRLEQNAQLVVPSTAVSHTSRELATNLATLLNPARIILGGGVLLGAVNLSALVRRRFGEKISRTAAKGLTVEQASLGEDAGVIGAALLERGRASAGDGP